METLTVYLFQSWGANLAIFLLLLIVAGLIGYLTAYFYYKSIYTKEINVLETEKTALINLNQSLSEKVTKLENEIQKKDIELNQLKGEQPG